jgi:hypothetical protein
LIEYFILEFAQWYVDWSTSYMILRKIYQRVEGRKTEVIYQETCLSIGFLTRYFDQLTVGQSHHSPFTWFIHVTGELSHGSLVSCVPVEILVPERSTSKDHLVLSQRTVLDIRRRRKRSRLLHASRRATNIWSILSQSTFYMRLTHFLRLTAC